MKVSLPVIINEPISALQRFGEFLVLGHDLFHQASMCDDPAKRMILVAAAMISGNNCAKIRKRKPFNPMLGETYELVTSDFRFMSEKVQHQPNQVSACCLEGPFYKVWAHAYPGKGAFSFNGGKGCLDFPQNGVFTFHFDKYDEDMAMNFPTV